jgi:integrase
VNELRKDLTSGEYRMAYITRRGRGWFAQVNRLGTRRSKSFPTKVAARAWADTLESAILAGCDPHDDITLGGLIDRYIEEENREELWGKAKLSTLGIIRRSIGFLTLPEITVQAIVEFSHARKLAGAGPATITHDLSCLSACLDCARVLWELPIAATLVKDARHLLRRRRIAMQSRPRGRLVTPAELAHLEAAWVSEIPFDVVRFALTTCMRRAEVLRLRWEDYSPERHTIVVRDRKHPTAKQGNDQRVPLLRGSWAIVERQPRWGPLIFPYDAKRLYRAWVAARSATGLEDARFHDLRHTGITAMFRRGWKINEVSIVSGHKDWQSLKRYHHMNADDMMDMEAAQAAAEAAQQAMEAARLAAMEAAVKPVALKSRNQARERE